MTKKDYPIIKKMQTIWLLRDNDIKQASQKSGVPVRTLRKWEKEYDQIKAQYYKYLDDEAVHKVMVAQNRMADKIGDLTNAITADKIKNAPLNQIGSTLGILVDRFIRIHNAKEIETTADNTFRLEYLNALTGEVTDAPSWAEDNPDGEPSLHDSFLWQALRQDGTGETDRPRINGAGKTGLVARSHVSDGSTSLARPEDSDDERDWNPR